MLKYSIVSDLTAANFSEKILMTNVGRLIFRRSKKYIKEEKKQIVSHNILFLII